MGITYNAGTNTVTVTGTYSGNLCSSIMAADTAGGWGVTFNQGSQYLTTAKWVIGDGSTATACSDTLKDIVFNDTTGTSEDKLIEVKAAATLTLGTLVDSTTKATTNGCSITQLANVFANIDETGGTANFYSCRFVTGGTQILNLRHTLTLYNCQLIGTSYRDADGVYFNNTYTGTYWVWDRALVAPFSSGTYSLLKFFSSGYIMRLWAGCTLSDLYARYYSSGLALFEANNITVNLVNADVSSWTFNFNGKTGCTVTRQYTFDVETNTSATVTLKNAAGNTVFSVTSDGTTGKIATQTVSRGYYTQTTGNTLQDYGPFTLTISKAGYITYTYTGIVLDEPIDWRISLKKLSYIGNGTIKFRDV